MEVQEVIVVPRKNVEIANIQNSLVLDQSDPAILAWSSRRYFHGEIIPTFMAKLFLLSRMQHAISSISTWFTKNLQSEQLIRWIAWRFINSGHEWKWDKRGNECELTMECSDPQVRQRNASLHSSHKYASAYRVIHSIWSYMGEWRESCENEMIGQWFHEQHNMRRKHFHL